MESWQKPPNLGWQKLFQFSRLSPSAISMGKCASLAVSRSLAFFPLRLLFRAAKLHTRHIFGFHFSASSGRTGRTSERGRARARVGANENSIPVTLKPETNEENVIGRKGRPPRRARESDRGRFRRRCPKDYIQILLRNPLSARLFDQQRSVIYAPPPSRPSQLTRSSSSSPSDSLLPLPSLPPSDGRTDVDV